MKKFFSLSLACLLLLCAVGCSTPTDGTTETTSGNVTTTAPATTAAPEPYYLDTLTDARYDGVTFTMIGEDTAQRPNFSSGELNGDVINDSVYKRQSMLEDRYGLTIETVSMTSRGNCSKEVRTRVQANDDTYDLVFAPLAESGMNGLSTGGYLAELSEMPYLDLTKSHWSQQSVQNLAVDGKLFSVAGAASPSYYLAAAVMLFNVEKAEAYQLPDLYKLVEEGKWTVDKVGELLAQCTTDLDGDNVYSPTKDFIALVQTLEAGNSYFIAAGGKLIEKKGDGTYTLGLNSEKNIALMDKLQLIFGDPVNTLTIDAKSVTVDLGDTKKTKLGLFAEGHAMFATTAMMFVADELRSMEDDYGILPLPKFNEAQEDYISPCNPYAPCGVAIPRTATDIELSALVMEAMAFLGEEIIRPAVYDTTVQGRLTRDEQSSKMLEMIYADIYYDFNHSFNFGDSNELLRAYVVNDTGNALINGRGFASSYTMIEKVAEKELETLIKALNGQ